MRVKTHPQAPFQVLTLMTYENLLHASMQAKEDVAVKLNLLSPPAQYFSWRVHATAVVANFGLIKQHQ